jgi:hypothetical protein
MPVPHTLVTSLGTAVAFQLLALSAVFAHADPDRHEPRSPVVSGAYS